MAIRKNDRLVIVIGIVILLVSSIGIYLWAPPVDSHSDPVDIEDILNISGVFSDLPNSIVVSDDSPFYSLITTPLAVHYEDEEQNVIPLFIRNLENPSAVKSQKVFFRIVCFVFLFSNKKPLVFFSIILINSFSL